MASGRWQPFAASSFQGSSQPPGLNSESQRKIKLELSYWHAAFMPPPPIHHLYAELGTGHDATGPTGTRGRFAFPKDRLGDIVALLLGLALSIWIYRGLLDYLGFNGEGYPLAFLIEASSGFHFLQLLYWGPVLALRLSPASLAVIPPILMVALGFWSSYFLGKNALATLSPSIGAFNIWLSSLSGALIYTFSIESFSNWGGTAEAHALIPLFGALAAWGYGERNKVRFLSIYAIILFIYIGAFMDYPVVAILFMVPLSAEFLIWVSAGNDLRRALWFSASLLLAIILIGASLLFFSGQLDQVSPQNWNLNSITANSAFLNSGQFLMNTLLGVVNPSLVPNLGKAGPLILPMFFVPLLAYLSLATTRGKERALSVYLAALSLATVSLFSIDFLGVKDLPLAVTIAKGLPPSVGHFLITVTEYRFPQFLLSFTYSLMVILTFSSILGRLKTKGGARTRVARAAAGGALIVLVALSSASYYLVETPYTNIPHAGYYQIDPAPLNAEVHLYEHQAGGAAMWLPLPYFFEFSSIPSKALIWYPWGSDGPSSTWYLSFAVGQDNRRGLLGYGEYQKMAAFLADAGIEYLGLYGSYSNYAGPLLSSGAFSLFYRDGNVSVLRDALYNGSWSSDQALYVDGGLQTYSSLFDYFSALGYNYQSPVPFYIDREPVPDVGAYPGVFLFNQMSTPYDVAVLFLNGTAVIPARYCNNALPPWQAWNPGAVTQVGFPWSFWTNYYGYLNQYTYQLDYGLAYTVSEPGSPLNKTLTVTFYAPSAGDEVMLVRYYVSQNPHPLYVTVNGNQTLRLDQESGSYLGGFVWEPLNVTVRQGENYVSFTSTGGTSAVNLVELASPAALRQALDAARQVIAASGALEIVYLTNSTQTIVPIIPGRYTVYAYSASNGSRISISAYGNTTAVHLSKGLNELGQLALPSQFNVTGHSVGLGSTLLLVRGAPASAGGGYEILVKPYLYDYTWNKDIWMGGRSYSPYPAYGESTAYLISGPGRKT